MHVLYIFLSVSSLLDARVTFIPGLMLEFTLAHMRVVILWLKKALSYLPYSVLFYIEGLVSCVIFCEKHNPLSIPFYS